MKPTLCIRRRSSVLTGFSAFWTWAQARFQAWQQARIVDAVADIPDDLRQDVGLPPRTTSRRSTAPPQVFDPLRFF